MRQVYVDVPALARHRDSLARHQQNWRRACRQVGAAMATVTAEDVCAATALTPLEEMGLIKPS